MHDFDFHEGGIIIDHHCYVRNELLKNQLEEEFGEFKYAVKYYLANECQSDSPEIWQKWWTNQMVGNASDDEDDGPWNSPQMAPGTVRGCHSRGHRDRKKRPGVDIFFSVTLAGLTNLHNQARIQI